MLSSYDDPDQTAYPFDRDREPEPDDDAGAGCVLWPATVLLIAYAAALVVLAFLKP